ncbi:MAG: sigma-70 family RNA polymerase sigma factor [Anaerolineae bacterium]|nr:sigma-70 family RNA polymerase sigma factor [Anaerolineae bacterium]
MLKLSRFALASLAWRPVVSILVFATSLREEGYRRAGRGGPGGPREYDEAALLAAAQRGDLPAFNQIILHYQSLAYNIAYRLTNDSDVAADAVQDAFIKAYQRLSQYRGGSFKSWLLRIVTNTCYARKNAGLPPRSTAKRTKTTPSTTPG